MKYDGVLCYDAWYAAELHTAGTFMLNRFLITARPEGVYVF